MDKLQRNDRALGKAAILNCVGAALPAELHALPFGSACLSFLLKCYYQV